VCRTDLHVLDGELPDPKLPLVLGHEIVGTVAGAGPGSERFTLG
jgi:propanol-preferring alcohol dehydrogenase